MRTLAYWFVILLLFIIGCVAVFGGNMFAVAFILMSYVVVAMWAGEHGPVEE